MRHQILLTWILLFGVVGVYSQLEDDSFTDNSKDKADAVNLPVDKKDDSNCQFQQIDRVRRGVPLGGGVQPPTKEQHEAEQSRAERERAERARNTQQREREEFEALSENHEASKASTQLAKDERDRQRGEEELRQIAQRSKERRRTQK